jgi:hypothetical protein
MAAREAWETFKGFFRLVRDFLREFWSATKQGTAKHRKGVVLFLCFVFLCFFVVVVAAYKISEQSFFCGLCHNMTVYVDSWKHSSHRTVPCIDCHYKPGFMNHLKGKWKDGQLSLAYFITGKSPTRPHAEVDDASCLQSGCHKREDIKKPQAFKNVVFNHEQHLGRMKRDKELRCTTCHSQIVQGAHMKVTDVECYICHFYKTKGQKEYITGCGSCHFEARGDIEVSPEFTFNHKIYIQRGIKCQQCHTNVIQGDGHIAENACLQCHNKREILEAKYTAAFLHKKHVTDHKVECFFCHSAIKHKTIGLHYTGQEATSCSECHKEAIHSAKVSMYTGKGAALVKDRPMRMAVINMDCDVCHGQGFGRNAQVSCKGCHGDLTDGMVDQWKKLLKDGREELQKEIVAATAKVGAQNKAVKDAQFNLEYLVKGNGAHNIVYAVQVIDTSKAALQKASGKSETPAKKGSQLSCVKLCHVQIADRKVRFGSTSFSHAIHAEGDDSCLKCHSPYAQHGKTELKDCSSCHHGEGMGKVSCTDCHRSEEAMRRGKEVKGIKESPDSMHGKVSCLQCHPPVKQGKKDTVAGVKAACSACHKKGTGSTVDEWASQEKSLQTKYRDAVAALEKEVAAIEAQEKRHSVPLRAVLDEIRQDATFVTKGRWSHNPQYSAVIVKKIDANIEKLKAVIADAKAGKKIPVKTNAK